MKKPYSDRHRQGADGRIIFSFLEREPIPSRSREMIQLAKEKEEYYLRKVAAEFQQFVTFNGQPENFSLCPHNMQECEIRMSRAAVVGDHRLVSVIGDHYLKRALAYLDLWRMRVLRLQDQGDPVPPPPPRKGEPDKIEIRSSRIARDVQEEGSNVLPFPQD